MTSTSQKFYLPPHLAGTQPTGIQESEPVAQFEIGNYKNFVYLLLDWVERKAAVVDPQSDLTPILEALNQFDFEVTHLLITHSHFDHIAGVPGLMKALPTPKLYIHPKDSSRLDSLQLDSKRISLLQQGEKIRVGALSVDVMHTPGHSAGECCYFVDGKVPYLFTGDTVFIRDCGRTDLDSGSNDDMFESLQKIRQLPENTVLLPGHHYQKECATVLGRELLESPPFRCGSVTELAQLP